MRILYILGDNGSGVEQVGWTFLGMLYKIGCKVDLVYTQANDVINQYMEKSKDYDYVIGNDFSEEKFFYLNRPINFINFIHGRETDNDNDIYLYTKSNMQTDRVFLYPFKCLDLIINKIYLSNYIGRFMFEKFPKNIIDEYFSNIQIDISGINSKKLNEIDSGIFKKIFYNIPTSMVYNILRSSAFNINPTVSECFGLVFGESLCNGCIPLIWDFDQKSSFWGESLLKIENLEHFYDVLNKEKYYYLKYYDYFVYYRSFFDINKSLKILHKLFSINNKNPLLNILYGQFNKQFLYNASYIIGEDIDVNYSYM